MAVPPVRQNIQYPSIRRIGKYALVLLSAGIAFKFVYGENLRKTGRMGHLQRVEYPYDRRNRNTLIPCNGGKGTLVAQGFNNP